MIAQNYPHVPSSEDELEDLEANNPNIPLNNSPSNNAPNDNAKTSNVFFTDGGHNFASAPDIDGHEGHEGDTLSLADSVEEFDSNELKKAWDKATGSQESDNNQTTSENSNNKTIENDVEVVKPKFDVAIGGPGPWRGQKDDNIDKSDDTIVDKRVDGNCGDKNVPTVKETSKNAEGPNDQSELTTKDVEESKPKFQVAIGGPNFNPWWASGQKDDKIDVDDHKSISERESDERDEGEISEETEDMAEDSPAPPPMSPIYCSPTSPRPQSPIDCVSPPMRTSTDEDEPHESDEEKSSKKSSRKSSIIQEESSSVAGKESEDVVVTSSQGPEDNLIPTTSGATCNEPLDIKLEQKEITSEKSIIVKHDPDKVAESSNPEISAYDLSIQGTVRSFFWPISG